MFRSWTEASTPELAIHAVELRSRGDRSKESSVGNLRDMVHRLARDIVGLFNSPFALFGHGFGAIVSCKLACQLRNDFGLMPAHLLVSAHRAPHLPPREMLHALPDEVLIRCLAALRGLSDQIPCEPELVTFFLSLIRTDLTLTETYVIDPGDACLDCRITVLGASEDPSATQQKLEAWSVLPPIPSICCGSVEVISAFNLNMHVYLLLSASSYADKFRVTTPPLPLLCFGPARSVRQPYIFPLALSRSQRLNFRTVV